jgi:hypothetical protein
VSENEKRQPKSYKIFGQQREKVEDLFKQSGIEFEGDFLDHMASVYEMNQLKTGIGAGYQKQITTLEYHTKSIVDSFLSMVQTETADRLQVSEDYEGKLEVRANEVFAQQQEIRSLINELDEKATESSDLKLKMKEQTQLIEALQKSSAKDDLILIENRDRIERLSKMLTDSTDAVDHAKLLEQRFTELTKITEDQAKQLTEAQTQRELLERQHEDVIEALTSKHADELARGVERAEISQEKAVLAARRDLMEQVEKERGENNADIRRLYEELDKLRQQLSEK